MEVGVCLGFFLVFWWVGFGVFADCFVVWFSLVFFTATVVGNFVCLFFSHPDDSQSSWYISFKTFSYRIWGIFYFIVFLIHHLIFCIKWSSKVFSYSKLPAFINFNFTTLLLIKAWLLIFVFLTNHLQINLHTA